VYDDKSEENKESNWFQIPDYHDTIIHQVLLILVFRLSIFVNEMKLSRKFTYF